MDFKQLFSRMKRAAMLDSELYEEVEHDAGATVQAGLVVVLARLLSGVGILFVKGPMALVGTVIMSLVAWAVWSSVTFFIGTVLFGGKADIGEMLRVLGFAYTPVCLGIIPLLGGQGRGWASGSCEPIVAKAA